MVEIVKTFWYDKYIKKIVHKKSVGKVLSIHRDYINILLNRNKIITIVKDKLSNLPQGPYRFVINKKRFNDTYFNKTIFPNDIVLFKQKHIEIGEPTKIIFLLPSKGTNVSLTKNFFIKNEINKKLIYKFLKYINSRKPLIEKKVLYIASKTLFYLRCGDIKNLSKMIKKNVGLGQGSTPEFDDFICGILTSFYVFDTIKSLSKEYKNIYDLMKTEILKLSHKTTLLSYNFILQFCETKFSLRIIKLIENLFKRNITYLKKIVKLILLEGESSGWWFLYGFFTTLLLISPKGKLK